MGDRRTHWAVVGGGVLGMRLASGLAERGRDVTVIEASPDLGGLAAAWQILDVTWDRHYHVIAPSDRRTIRMIDELGLSADLRWVSVPAGAHAGRTVHPATTPAEISRLPGLGLTAKARLAATAARATSIRDPQSVSDVTAVDWLRRWSGREATERFWIPLLRSKLGSTVEQASAVFIVTTLRRLLRARLDGRSTGDGFGYVAGGYARILARMEARLADVGVKTRLGHRVTSVRRDDSGLAVTTSDGTSAVYDKVVVTTAAPVAAALCEDLSDQERAACQGITYQGIVCLSLLLSQPLTHNYITYLLEPQPFTAVIDMSALVGPDQLGGYGLVYLPAYVRSDDPLFGSGEDDLVSRWLPALETVYPGASETIVATRVSSVRHVLPVPTVGYPTRLPPIRTSVPGLFLASSALITDGTLNVNETIGVAERALPVLLADVP